MDINKDGEIDTTDYNILNYMVNGVRGEYVDNDKDGFYDDDCNDDDISIRPGTLEVCGDGIDQDCNGFDEDCATIENIIINEVMPNPIGDESVYEWIELYNPNWEDVNLNGWVIDYGTAKTISGDLILKGRKYLILCEDSLLEKRGISCDYEFDALSLANGGDTITLSTDAGDIIDSMTYGSTITTEGASLQLIGNSWVTSYSDGDCEYGTPGTKNNVIGGSYYCEFQTVPELITGTEETEIETKETEIPTGAVVVVENGSSLVQGLMVLGILGLFITSLFIGSRIIK